MAMSFDTTSAICGDDGQHIPHERHPDPGRVEHDDLTGLNGSKTNPSNYTITNYTGAPATIAAGNKVILTDVFVLQISYNQAAAAAAGSTAEFIGWNFGGGFVNATFGNSGTGSAGGAPTLFEGAANGEYMNESYADYLAGLQPDRPDNAGKPVGRVWVLRRGGMGGARSHRIQRRDKHPGRRHERIRGHSRTQHMGHGRFRIWIAHRQSRSCANVGWGLTGGAIRSGTPSGGDRRGFFFYNY